MAKKTRTKTAKGPAARKAAEGRRVAKVERALETALKREAKAASRLEAAQAETATLRVLLAGLVEPAREMPVPAPALAPAATSKPAAKAPAARVTPAKAPAATPAARPAAKATPTKATPANAPAARPAAAATPARPRRTRTTSARGAAPDR